MIRRWSVLVLPTALALPLLALSQPEAEYPHGNYSEDCGLCHSSEQWKPLSLRADFDHAAYGFALEGSHRDVFCGFCHTSLDFTTIDARCGQCHTDVHNGELGESCGDCHGVESFSDLGDQIRMHRLTSFPLTDAHLTLDCEACHPTAPQGTATFRLTDSSCGACHLAAYQATTSPDHEVAGFSRECEICHRPTDWRNGYFNHEVLVKSGAACVECHRDDYDRTTDPNHTDSGFPLDCDGCHNTRGWDGANFEHDSFFPIPHREARACSDCHTVPSDYSAFSCLGCHPHDDRTETDAHHQEEQDYVYESAACYECHPRGRK